MNALSAEEFLAYVEVTSQNWRTLASAHPEILDFPCDIRETANVRELLQHIVAVELRYAERLSGQRETPYDQVPMASVDALYSVHERAMTMLRELLDDSSYAWEERIDLVTRSLGTLTASPRTIFLHTLLHSIRHYAQLATLVRQHGVKPEFYMDYLLMGATPK